MIRTEYLIECLARLDPPSDEGGLAAAGAVADEAEVVAFRKPVLEHGVGFFLHSLGCPKSIVWCEGDVWGSRAS